MRSFGIAVFMFLILCAAPALAIDYPCADNESSCGGGQFDGDLTEGESTGGFKGPQGLVCYALRSKNQRCRACETQYFDSGQPTGQTVCAYVDRDEACSCQFSGSVCATVGSCSYFAQN